MFQRVPFIPAVYDGCHFESHFLDGFLLRSKSLDFPPVQSKNRHFVARVQKL
jgi:hypothetical protein